ncbi:17195_t:CDS:2 [Funneliformis caledonium]|uniref:17195_t:CDS:1 n=1 Tax=Funneliformis caledonium TaxID=1117310 RepID=A0A9N8Z3T2_9GLOM|nr:17195_t:CDS:2 [Funneliformis caledonium]
MNKIGKFSIELEIESDTEENILEEQLETGLDDTFSENDWENDEVSDWESDTDLEAEQDMQDRLLKIKKSLLKNYPKVASTFFIPRDLWPALNYPDIMEIDSNMSWVLPNYLKDKVDSLFFISRWNDWRLIEFLEFKKSDILAGLSKKQLSPNMLESEDVKTFWKNMERLTILGASASFESNVLKVRMRRFCEEIDDMIEREAKINEMNECTSILKKKN